MLLLKNLDARTRDSNTTGSPTSNQACLDAFNESRSIQGTLPVTRSDHVDHLADPTTFGVHLYKDGAGSTSTPQGPADETLFADCEGFFTGPTQTNAERLTGSPNQDVIEANLLYKAPITAKSYAQHGQEGAELYYARFLYSVSDVVVFVTNEDQNITALLVSALEWAATAVLHSVNYPSRKTLIIVRNGAAGEKQQIIDNESLQRLYLEGRNVILWNASSVLRTFVNDYNGRQDKFSKHIYDNRDLYDVLFDRCLCFCVPRINDIKQNRDETMFAQYLGLRAMIDEASQRALDMRSQVWMNYEVPSSSQMLFEALEHFRTRDEPFNFNEVARFSKPNPQSSAGHIANFIRLALNVPNPRTIKTMIPDVLAMSFIIWFMRTLDRGKGASHIMVLLY